MEDLRDIAKTHYLAGSERVKDLASKFFDSMDRNRDGRIDLGEFLEFTSQKCPPGISSHYFFKKLDRDGKGTLGFWEIMTLYYIIKSGRPFCSFCDRFIPGIFFSCVGCPFTLCHDCYRSSKCDHNHHGRTQFLDNYTLLQITRDSAHPTETKQDKISSTSIIPAHKRISSTSIIPAHKRISSTSIIPTHKGNKWNAAYKALNVAIAFGNIAATMCTIL